MDDGFQGFQDILDSVPEKRSRSRLEPYGRLIHGLLRRSRSYREIARILRERFHLHASISTIHDFVRIRAGQARKSRKRNPAGYDQTTKGNAPERENKMPMDVIAPRAALEEVQRIAALKIRPAEAPAQSQQFHYDPSEPLHLPQKTESGRAEK